MPTFDSLPAETRVERVQMLRAQIAAKLEEIERLYKDSVKVTLIVRVPSKPDGSRDTVMTNDDPETAIAALRSLYADPSAERWAGNG